MTEGGDVMRRVLIIAGILALGISAFAQWVPHDPIYIYGDEDFTWEKGVVRGSGTADDPYVIEGWVIDTLGYDYGIYIDHTKAHFIIRNCLIRYPQEKAGILLSAVENGRIEDCAIWGGHVGIQLLSARKVTITRTAIGYCDYGILVSTGSDHNVIYSNSIIACGLPARDPISTRCSRRRYRIPHRGYEHLRTNPRRYRRCSRF